MFLVDSHCHLNLLDLSLYQDNLDNVLAKAKQNGVQHILNVCVDLYTFDQVINTAIRYPFVSASVGMHPNEHNHVRVTSEELIKLAQHGKVIAIGETGLDYFRSTGDLEWQRDRFRAHIQAAKDSHKPLIVHTRQAKEDTIQIMREESVSTIGGVMHCFTEDWPMAKQALDMNFYISFSGIVTFKNAGVIQEVAKQVPLDRILIETDAPYLAPVPFRGKPNEPAFVYHTAEYIAKLRKMPFEDFAENTTQNFFKLFKGAEVNYV